MLISAAIVSKVGRLFLSNNLPDALNKDITKHAKNFIYAMSIGDDDIEFPYIETTHLRYIYKESGDLYWLLVTKLDSDMFTDMHLLGKFVCTIMEYGMSETNSVTLTVEQKELFYRHLWRPWDDDATCLTCNRPYVTAEYWEREFDNRLQFLIDIRNGHVEESDVDYFNRLIHEAWVISAKLSPKWGRLTKLGCSKTSLNDDSDSKDERFCRSGSYSPSSEIADESISEEAIIDGCRLRCLFEDIKIEANRMQDPYLRLFAKKTLLNNNQSLENDELQVCSAPSFREDMNDVTAQCDQSNMTDELE